MEVNFAKVKGNVSKSRGRQGFLKEKVSTHKAENKRFSQWKPLGLKEKKSSVNSHISPEESGILESGTTLQISHLNFYTSFHFDCWNLEW